MNDSEECEVENCDLWIIKPLYDMEVQWRTIFEFENHSESKTSVILDYKYGISTSIEEFNQFDHKVCNRCQFY